MQWIEEAEARRVLTATAFERPPKAPWRGVAANPAAQWLPRLACWLAVRHPLGWPVAQPQPALVRARALSPSRDDDRYSCCW
jgi:hypothetical protein